MRPVHIKMEGKAILNKAKQKTKHKAKISLSLSTTDLLQSGRSIRRILNDRDFVVFKLSHRKNLPVIFPSYLVYISNLLYL